MKKLALLAALALMGACAWAQQVSIVSLNNFSPDRPIFYLKDGTAATTANGLNVQVMGGPVGGTLAPVVNTEGKSTFQLVADSYFDGGIGIIPGVSGTGPADLQLRIWEGADYGTAKNALTVKWTQPVTAWDSTPPNPPPATIADLAIPQGSQTVVPVPEPSTIALGLLGAAALLIRRRK